MPRNVGFLLHGIRLRPKSIAVELYPPDDIDEFKRFDFLEVYTFYDPRYSNEFQAWRGWISKGREYPGFSPLEKIKRDKEEQWRLWILQYRTRQLVDEGVDWVWTSNKNYPFNKHRTRVY